MIKSVYLRSLVVVFGLCLNFQFAKGSERLWNGKVFNAKTLEEVTPVKFVEKLSTYSTIVLGEKHYTPAVQLAEANIIRSVVEFSRKAGSFTTAWEFLNASTQQQTEYLFKQVKAGQISAEQFLRITQNNYAPSVSYAPVLERTSELGGQLLGVNLTRAEKAPIIEKGLDGVDPKLIPPGFGYGSEGYFARFKQVMAGHTTPEQLKNFYSAQCLTDDVMAYQLLQDSKDSLKFLIAGSFHTDYFDGVVARLKIRVASNSVVSVSIIDATDFEASELLGLLQDATYGPVADYVYFVNEPKTR